MSSLLTTQNKQITQSVLLMIAACIESGEVRILRDMGLTDPLIEEMTHISASNLMTLVERVRANFLDIKVNTENFGIVLKDLRNNELVRQLLIAGAPNELIVNCIGVSSKQCGVRRKELGIDGYATQRVPQNEEEHSTIIKLWMAFKAENGLLSEDISGDHWLKLHQFIAQEYREISLKVIHYAINKYNTDEQEYQLMLGTSSAQN